MQWGQLQVSHDAVIVQSTHSQTPLPSHYQALGEILNYSFSESIPKFYQVIFLQLYCSLTQNCHLTVRVLMLVTRDLCNQGTAQARNL